MALTFGIPFLLWFLLLIPLIIVLHVYSLKIMKRRALKFANFEAIARATGKPALSRNFALLLIRILILTFMVFAIAKTSLIYTGQSNDFDYVIAIDASSSMAAKDIFPSRLEAAKSEAINFMNSLSSKTSVGIISFSGTTSIETQITDDLAVANSAIRGLEIRTTGGTDFGEAIQTGVNLLIPRQKDKVIILMTDGRNNAGVPIDQAIKYAADNGVLIHTIGIATKEGGEIENLADAIFRLDEDTLIVIALGTGGQFFRVGDANSLRQAYDIISTSTLSRVTTDLSPILLIVALFLLIF